MNIDTVKKVEKALESCQKSIVEIKDSKSFAKAVSDWSTGVTDGFKIRKLTPKECFRLMGFDDVDVDLLIENGISNTQLYKMAGNSIVVNMLEFLFCQIFDNEIWV